MASIDPLVDNAHSTPAQPRWTTAEVAALYDLSFSDLVFRAQTVHREHFDPNTVQLSTLLSVKTGACPEDCSYCPQSARYKTEVEPERLLRARGGDRRQGFGASAVILRTGAFVVRDDSLDTGGAASRDRLFDRLQYVIAFVAHMSGVDCAAELAQNGGERSNFLRRRLAGGRIAEAGRESDAAFP